MVTTPAQALGSALVFYTGWGQFPQPIARDKEMATYPSGDNVTLLKDIREVINATAQIHIPESEAVIGGGFRKLFEAKIKEQYPDLNHQAIQVLAWKNAADNYNHYLVIPWWLQT